MDDSQKRHLIVLENEPSSMRGGQERSLFEVCRALESRGHRITLLYVTEGDLLSEYKSFCEQTVCVKSFSVDRTKTVSAALSFFRDVMRVPHPEHAVIYSNQYHDTLFGAALSWLKGIPFVCHLRLRPPAPPCGQWRLGLSAVDHFIAISERTKAEWIGSGVRADRIEVVYNGVDAAQFRPIADRARIRSAFSLKPEDPAILYVGRLDPGKGLECLIRAVGILRKNRHLPAKLILAGRPLCYSTPEAGERYIDSLRDLGAAENLGDDLRFLGHVANPAELYGACDITVLPSNISEAFGRVLIESMACGTPAIGSRIGGIPEVLKGEFEDMLFQPDDAVGLSETLSSVLDRRMSDHGLSARCREHATRHFSLKDTIDGVEKILIGAVS